MLRLLHAEREHGMTTHNDGFGALWGILVEQVRLGLLSDYPQEVVAFRDLPPDRDDVTNAVRLGMRERYTKALESGMACRLSISRIANAMRIAGHLDPDHPLAPEIEIAVVDGMSIYLSAYIDGLRKFIERSIGQLLPEDDDTRQRREEIGRWCAAAKQTLSTARQHVAHADTGYISGITEEGLWPPMVLAGGLNEQAIIEAFRQDLAINHAKFRERIERLHQVAVMALAQGEAQMGATATLIRAKLDQGKH